MKKNAAKRALLMSVISLMLCVSMLVGTTFAWFTDSVTSANNIIKSGNLDVELYYQVEGQNDWTKLTSTSNIFMENALWEPGHTEVVKLKIVNEGSLALKYQLGVNVATETGSVNVNGEAFMLSDFIQFGFTTDEIDGRDEAIDAVVQNATALSVGYASDILELMPAPDANSESAHVVTMVVYMPTTVGNEANHAKDEAVPTINLGINLFATQFEYEDDSFGDDYDQGAPIVNVPVARPTGAVTLKGPEDVMITLPNEVVQELPDEITELSLAVSEPIMDTNTNTITFKTVEVVDQDGNVIDLETLNTTKKVTVTLPAQTMFAPDETVMIYHDDEFIATATVKEDTTIVYEVEHLCEVTIGTTKAPIVDAEDANVIKISNVAELMGFAQSVNAGNNYKGKTVVLTADIDLNNVAWTPIGRIGETSTDFTYAFKGTFDGQDHIISNLNVSNTGWAGLFGLAHGAIINKVKINGATITSNRLAGAIVGQLYGSIGNCHVENVEINVTPNEVGDSYDNGDKVGGIVGWLGDNGNNRTLTGCSATNVTLSGYRDIGGIAGYVASSTTVANNTVTNYTITADQTVNFYGEKDVNAGAILGRINGTITQNDNVAAGEESKIVITYYKNGLALKTSSDSEEVLLYKVPSSYENGIVIVPEGVTNLGSALKGKQFAKLVIPTTVTSAYKSLENATIGEIVISDGATTIPNRMFYKTAIGNIVIPNTVTVIEQNAFAMAVVTEVVIPASVTTIEEAAFTHADYLETVTIMGNTAIQGYAFRGCDNLTTVYLYGDDVTFIPSTLNGRNSTWFCNSESNNPNTSNITFTVRSKEIKERVLTAMGAERNNTTIIVDDGFTKVESADTLLEALANATPGTKIDATGVTIDINNIGVDVPGGIKAYTIPGGVTIKGLNVVGSYRGGNYLVFGGASDQEIVFEDCSFAIGRAMGFGIVGDEGGATSVVYNNCTFAGPIITNFVDNPDGVATFNNCTFKKAASGDSYVMAMGGIHNFNGCTFDYTGVTQSNIGTVTTATVNSVSDSDGTYSTVVVLNGCTRINCGTHTYGPNSTLTVK